MLLMELVVEEAHWRTGPSVLGPAIDIGRTDRMIVEVMAALVEVPTAHEVDSEAVGVAEKQQYSAVVYVGLDHWPVGA
jgi:hypothetical protein